MTRRALIALCALTIVVAAGRTFDAQQTDASGPAPVFTPVTYERLLNSADEPENWLMYSGNYSSQRYSGLDQVTVENADRLRLKWVYQLRDLDRAETTPLVINGMMYVTESPSTVIALDATTGRVFWRYEHDLPEDVNYCCGRNNRGVAVLGTRLFMSTLDAHLVSLDARTGTVLWDTEVADAHLGYSKTAAPLVVKDKIITGIAGGEFGIRGFLDAYDPETGERVWRFYTIPGEGEPGNETWAGDSWKTGGSPTWMTGSYDPDADLVYWGTGNPGPDWNGEARLGDNLYSDSVLALDPDTGELDWYFQFTPHDVHDWDATQIPVLADIEFDGRARKMMLWPNRNAFFYVLDRQSGDFLRGTPFGRQTWAERIAEDGRPVRIPNMLPSVEGTLVSPPIEGAANWWSPSFSPSTGLLYVMAYDSEQIYFMREDEYVPGETAWDYPVQPRSSSGVLTTASDVLFGGTVDGYFFALDARTGEELWVVNVGGMVHAGPMTYSVGGQQRVTIAAGNTIFTFGLEE
ncbi:MAG: PQQ-binding-like beta-propeller repeat protein [Vicinamibacterales bacterium]|nr:PQQ-binding-like beta-propeller repeat protein [Vicinamibacterales bacterium]